jgi:hypothetical protein
MVEHGAAPLNLRSAWDLPPRSPPVDATTERVASAEQTVLSELAVNALRFQAAAPLLETELLTHRGVSPFEWP